MIQTLKSKNSSLKLKIACGMLIIIIVTGMSTTAYAASAKGSNEETSNLISFFDPFELRFMYLNISENKPNTAISSDTELPSQVNISANSQDANISSGIIRRSPIRIPYRPPCRSPFRPPWVPGPPPWYPGGPPWTPGPPPWNPNR
jgi:hypothetical protein